MMRKKKQRRRLSLVINANDQQTRTARPVSRKKLSGNGHQWTQKKQKLCIMCHGSKIKCLVEGAPAKKSQSNKAENKKKKAEKEQVNIVEFGGQDRALPVADSFWIMAEEMKGIMGLLQAHYNLRKANFRST
jgi:hypothetical protein